MVGMLENKVVVISGVGPALGTTLARRCAQAGADLVLAARTAERLEEVAGQVTALGRRALSVGTDITVDDQVDNLVSRSLEEFGRVDVLINNAFRVPSMKPLADTTFQHIRDAIELTVLGALRLTQGFTPALAEAKGSVVNVNSMVIRHSQPKYGAYKMAKAARLNIYTAYEEKMSIPVDANAIHRWSDTGDVVNPISLVRSTLPIHVTGRWKGDGQ